MMGRSDRLSSDDGRSTERLVGMDDGKLKRYSSITTEKCIHGKTNCCKLRDTIATIVQDSTSNAGSDISDHCHQNSLSAPTNAGAKRKLWTVSVLCLFFMGAEIVGGYFANSLAIASDAAHLLTDIAGFMISLFAIYIAERPATKQMSFGWHRAEVLGALLSVLLIYMITGILVYLAVVRLISYDFVIEADIMVITAGLGVVVNLVMMCVLKVAGVPHSHSHGGSSGHGHAHDAESGAHGHSHEDADANINVRAAYIHVIGDLLQSVGVLIAAGVILLYPTAKFMDPVMTFVFSIFVLWTTKGIVVEAFTVLMEGRPKGIDFQQVREKLCAIEGVRQVHNLRIWALTAQKICLSCHVGIDSSKADYHKIQKECLLRLSSEYGFHELTVQVEEYTENMVDCSKCNDLSD